MKPNYKNKLAGLCVVVLLLGMRSSTTAQEVATDFQTRTNFSLSYELIDDLKLSFTPELRFDESFILDKTLLEAELEYSPFKYLSLSTEYGYIINSRENKDTEYFHRLAFGASVKKKFNRFTPELRLKYSNYADDDVTDKEFLRVKGSLEYDIPNFKLTPFLGIESYQNLDGLSMYKWRYSVGADYKLFKNNSIGVDYKFDYYMQEYKNRHIFSVGYKLKF